MAEEMNKLVAHVGFEVDNETSSLDKISKQIEKINNNSKNLAKSLSTFEKAFSKLKETAVNENGNIVSSYKKTRTQLNNEAKQATEKAKAESKERIANANAEYEERKQIAKRGTELSSSNNKKALEDLKNQNKLLTISLNEEEKRRTASHNSQLKIDNLDYKESINKKKEDDRNYTSFWNSELKKQEAYSKETYANMVSNAKNSYSQMSSAVSSLGSVTNLNSTLGNANNRNQLGYAVANATLTVTGVRAVLNEFANVSKEVIEIEKNSINIQRIMGDTSEKTLNTLTKTAIDTAKSTATTVTDVQDIQNAWVRINDEYAKNIDLLNEISSKTAKFVNVGEIEDAEEAVKLLNSSILQFNMFMADGSVDIEEATKTLDKWAYMADKTALGTADEFGESISKIGGYVTSLGGDMDDAIVLTSILGDRLAKTGSEAGNSLKTITAYLTRDKTVNLFETLGLDSDGLTRSLMKTTTQFEEFEVIMDKVSSAYNDALANGDEVTAKAIQNAIGATRQGDSAIALLKNWAEDSKKYYAMIGEATEGGSYLDKQNEALMSSFSAQWNELKTSMVEFGYAFAKSGLLDGISSLMDGFSGLLEKISNLNPAVLKTVTTFISLGVALGGLTKISKLTGVYDVFSTAVKYGTVAQRQNAESLAIATKEYLKNELALKQTKVASDSFNSATQAEKAIIQSSLTDLTQKNIAFEKLTMQYKNGQINAQQYMASIQALNLQEKAENVTTAQGTTIDNASNVSKVAGKTATQGLTTATRLQTTAQSILNGVMSVGSAVMKTLLSPMFLITTAITVLIGLFSTIKTKVDEHNKAIETASQNYQEVSAELDNINSQLQETQDKIDSLNSKDNLTFVEQGEIEKLRESNRLLEIQRGLKENAQKIARQELEDSIRNEYQDNYNTKDSYGYVDGKNVKITGIDSLKNDIKSYEELNNKKITGIALTKNEQKQYEYLSKRISESGVELSNYLDKYETDDDFKKELTDISELIYGITNPAEYKTMKFEDIFNSESFSKAKKELTEMALAGNLDSSVLYKTTEYQKLLSETGLTASDVVQQILAIVKASGQLPTSEDLQEIVEPLNYFGVTDESIDDFQKKMSTIKSTLDGVDTIDSTGLIDLMQSFSDFDWSKFGVTGVVDSTGAVGDLDKALKELSASLYANLDPELKNNEAIKSFYEQCLIAKVEAKSLSESMEDLSSSAELIVNSQKEVDETNKLSLDTINNIIAKYPQLSGVLSDYLSGLASTTDVMNSIRGAYETDFENYKTAIISKQELSEDFYNTVVSNISKEISEKAKQYNIDFNNYKNLSEAKLDIEKKLQSKIASISMVQGTGDDVTAYEDSLLRFNKNYQKLQGYLAIINGLDTSIDTTLDLKGYTPEALYSSNQSGKNSSKDSSSKSEWSGQIDWYENSLDKLENSVEDAQEVFKNAEGYESQLEALNKLVKAQEALRDGYKKTANLFKTKYNNIKGIDSYKEKIESGQTFTIEDFGAGQEDLYNAVTQAQEFWNTWKENLGNVSDVTNDISSNYIEINKTLEESVEKAKEDIEDLQGQIVDALKKQYKESYDERVKYLKKEQESQVKIHNDRIKQLQAEIDKINGNTPEDKKNKLTALRQQYTEWLADDSTVGKSKQKELLDQITELDKEIKVDSIESQINSEEETIDEINNRFDELLDSDSEFYDKMLKDFDQKMTDQSLYTEANAMINKGQQQKIIDLLSQYNANYSGMATIMGQTAGEIIANQVASAMSGIASTLGSGLSSTGEFKAVDTSPNSTSSTSSGTKKSSIASTIQEGLSETMADIMAKIKKNSLGFDTGGYTGDGSGLAMLHKKERVLDSQQTNAFDYLVYNFLPEVTSGYKSSVKGDDITNNNNVFNKELVSLNVGSIINNTPYDVKNTEDNLSRTIIKGLQKSGMSTPI